MIKNIIFDMGNVLIAWDPPMLVRRLGLPEEDEALLLREVFACSEWTGLDRGSLDPDSAMALVAPRLPERLHAAARGFMAEWWKGPLVPIAGIAELIAELKGLGYGIYLLSNATSCLHEYFPRIPGSEHFDGKIVSADWKLLKPEHELYEKLFETFSLTPAECFFIDDNPLNIEAAFHLGMPGAVFFNDTARLRGELRRAGVPVKTEGSL
ncbi:MAG: HAD family phosphatase [Oscillospiraceae bacterium]|nr:HAD family phosphatase [Oscillospiraceae bacterium]